MSLDAATIGLGTPVCAYSYSEEVFTERKEGGSSVHAWY